MKFINIYITKIIQKQNIIVIKFVKLENGKSRKKHLVRNKTKNKNIN